MKLSFNKKDATRAKHVIIETAQKFAWGMAITKIPIEFKRNNTRVTATKDGLKDFPSLKLKQQSGQQDLGLGPLLKMIHNMTLKQTLMTRQMRMSLRLHRDVL